MSIPCKSELSVLTFDEQQLVLTSHHPAIGDADRAALEHLRVVLRGLRDKERTLAHSQRRVAKGSAEPRGRSAARKIRQTRSSASMFSLRP